MARIARQLTIGTDTYRYLGGTSRRYENVRTGETLSRRAAHDAAIEYPYPLRAPVRIHETVHYKRESREMITAGNEDGSSRLRGVGPLIRALKSLKSQEVVLAARGDWTNRKDGWNTAPTAYRLGLIQFFEQGVDSFAGAFNELMGGLAYPVIATYISQWSVREAVTGD